MASVPAADPDRRNDTRGAWQGRAGAAAGGNSRKAEWQPTFSCRDRDHDGRMAVNIATPAGPGRTGRNALTGSGTTGRYRNGESWDGASGRG